MWSTIRQQQRPEEALSRAHQRQAVQLQSARLWQILHTPELPAQTHEGALQVATASELRLWVLNPVSRVSFVRFGPWHSFGISACQSERVVRVSQFGSRRHTHPAERIVHPGPFRGSTVSKLLKTWVSKPCARGYFCKRASGHLRVSKAVLNGPNTLAHWQIHVTAKPQNWGGQLVPHVDWIWTIITTSVHFIVMVYWPVAHIQTPSVVFTPRVFIFGCCKSYFNTVRFNFTLQVLIKYRVCSFNTRDCLCMHKDVLFYKIVIFLFVFNKLLIYFWN